MSRSPTNRASRASTRGDSTRHKVATVASMFAAFMATGGGRSPAPGVLLKVLGLDDATYVDALRADEEGELAGMLDSLIE